MRKQTQSKLRMLIERIIKEEEYVRDLMSVAEEWVGLMQSHNAKSSETRANKLGKILFDAGILDENPHYEPGIGDTKYQWFGGKKLQGSYKRVAQYIDQNIS